MGSTQIALDPHPSVKEANVGKKCSKASWQAFRDAVKNVLADFAR